MVDWKLATTVLKYILIFKRVSSQRYRVAKGNNSSAGSIGSTRTELILEIEIVFKPVAANLQLLSWVSSIL